MSACDDNSGIRERLALLAALLTIARKRDPSVAAENVAASIGEYRYDPSRDWWIGMPGGAAAIVRVDSEASVQLARLKKLGVGYHEAMSLCGYESEDGS